jgi:hypothetical protein
VCAGPLTCARTHGLIDALAEVAGDLTSLADLGYEGAADIVRVPIKKAKGTELTDDQQTYNKLIRGIRRHRPESRAKRPR